MFGKLASLILGAEIVGLGILGAWAYSESRYYQGRRDAFREVNDSLGNLLKEVQGKHDSEKEAEA